MLKTDIDDNKDLLLKAVRKSLTKIIMGISMETSRTQIEIESPDICVKNELKLLRDPGMEWEMRKLCMVLIYSLYLD